ncbi:hypothetical protein [Escherichia coli]|uniref:hypothetical protein n=1 Tax=Escherichia coli TaxID=562 RepID=UPI000928F072|nr:hypothetical protein [Escherichia coli]OJP09865.1 hypothetical protein BK334_26660 [Escherichia coli]
MNIEEEDLRALERAVELLAQDTITETLTQLVGTPIDYLMSKLPKGAEKKIYSLVEKSLNKAANAALWSLDNEPRQPGGCKLKTAPVRPVVAARPAEYVCSEDLFY